MDNSYAQQLPVAESALEQLEAMAKADGVRFSQGESARRCIASVMRAALLADLLPDDVDYQSVLDACGVPSIEADNRDLALHILAHATPPGASPRYRLLHSRLATH